MKSFRCLTSFVAISYLLVVTSCKKDKIASAELVSVYGQTFGCQVNEKPFIADKWDYGNNIPPIHVNMWYSPVRRYHYFIASGNKENERVEIFLNPPLVQGRRELKFATGSYSIYALPNNYGLYKIYYPEKEFITNDTIGGYVDLIFADTIMQKIEGKFEFTGTNRYTGEKVKITNGYFKNF